MNISACIITNNNPAVIECIKSVEKTCNEIILVNTVPEFTLDISAFKNVKLFQFEWCDDFSKARNFSISKATGDWILVIDSDEILSTQILYLDPKYDIYFAKQVNSGIPFWNARVFKNNKGITYIHKMHESIEHHITKDNTSKSNIEILHNGYEISDEDMRAKLERNYQLMLKDVDNPGRNYHIAGYELIVNKDYRKALEIYHKALKDNLNAEHIASVYNNIYLCEMMLEFPIEYLLETLGKSIQTLPLQLVARINVIEHFLRGVNTENKNDIIPIIEKELGKIEKIYKGKMSELHTDIQINEQFIQTKKEEIRKWQ